MRTIVSLMILLLSCSAQGGIVNRLNVTNRIIALTFDACETKAPVHFDKSIVRFLTRKKIPFTVFVSGKFVRRNAAALKRLSCLPFVEIENHSLNHRSRMTNMSLHALTNEVVSNARLIKRITGKETKFFRFPYGRSNIRILAAVESMGWRVVGFSFESGDPDRNIPADRLLEWILRKTRPGSILIFHMNGRGWRTGQIMPKLIKALRKRGYSFVRLDEVLKAKTRPAAGP